MRSDFALQGITTQHWKLIRKRTGSFQKILNVIKTTFHQNDQQITHLSGERGTKSQLCVAQGLTFLVRLTNDMGLEEVQEYANKLKKAEKMREVREQVCLSPFFKSIRFT